ncbi:PPA1309 family protein [Gordonia rhizosphera]|uniref:PPA1309 family protein n=1 Tax=Gordonia rhizosphera TaxID=83341 RepID=UPI00058DF2FF
MDHVSDVHPDTPASDALSPDALGGALRDIVEFVDQDGWDQPPMLFALVPTAALARSQPDLVDADDDSELSPIAQAPLPNPASAEDATAELERVLATTSWPPTVMGAALVQEITVVPPDEPTSEGRPGRVAAGALRDGRTLGLLQLRPEPGADPEAGIELLTHPDLAVELRTALAHTLDVDPAG